MDALIRRLRQRAAGDPAPVPAGYPVAGRRRPAFDPETLKLDPDDEIAIVGQYGRAGRRTCLLAVTPLELVIMRLSQLRILAAGWLTHSMSPSAPSKGPASSRAHSSCAAPGRNYASR